MLFVCRKSQIVPLNKVMETATGLATHSFLVVGNDAADKIGVGVPQRGHQLGQLLLVQLAHGAEHALLGFVRGTECRLVHAGDLVQADDVVHWGWTNVDDIC